MCVDKSVLEILACLCKWEDVIMGIPLIGKEKFERNSRAYKPQIVIETSKKKFLRFQL